MEMLTPLKVFHALSSHKDEDGPYYSEENLLPDWATQFDLLLQIQHPWPGSAVENQKDTLQLWMLKPGRQVYEQVETFVLEGLITFPRFITLGKEHLEEGVSKVKFEVITQAGEFHESEAVTFTVDKRVPLNGQRPVEAVIDNELTDEGVTNAYLKAHCYMVPVVIPVYEGQTTGQQITVFCGGPDAPPVAVAVVRTPDPLNVPGGQALPTVVMIADYVFHSLANGVHMLFYRIANRAGLQTTNSMGVFIRVGHAGTGSANKPRDGGLPA
ncbi:hypothetical protein [Pseudomonas frederiksbergensis]|jgi:hypothetical protein|uniref:hypothetical protein n=1 Tax=Pseudomonas frederiksbergensis TaxID=104087 RepID=UPI002DBA8773|nr:hypothetical protein [Pseudomonas frederiksbergensis]WRV66396.1 hypothetical protein VQ575_16050 [Pseudomonas frederiksbergensis]